MAAIVDTLIEWLRSPPVPTMSIGPVAQLVGERHELGRREHGVEQARQLLGVSPLARSATTKPISCAGGGVAGEDRRHRGPRLHRREVTPVEQLGQQRGPSAVVVEF